MLVETEASVQNGSTCPNCGTRNSEGVTFCGQCGARMKPVGGTSGAGWTGATIAAAVLSVASVILMFLNWFEIRYLNYFTDDFTFSVYDLVTKWARIGRYFDLELVGFVTGIIYVMAAVAVLCIVLHIVTVVQVIRKQGNKVIPSVGAAGLVSAIECILAFIVLSEVNAKVSVLMFTAQFYLFAAVSLAGMIYYGLLWTRIRKG